MILFEILSFLPVEYQPSFDRTCTLCPLTPSHGRHSMKKSLEQLRDAGASTCKMSPGFKVELAATSSNSNFRLFPAFLNKRFPTFADSILQLTMGTTKISACVKCQKRNINLTLLIYIAVIYSIREMVKPAHSLTGQA